MNQTELKNSISDFPTGPGVYLMRNKEGQIIYVGKAIRLRQRVRSYFASQKDRKTRALIRRVHTIDFVLTANAYEALILENNLVKEHTPRYNINLRDGKTYPLIRITADDYPRIFRTRHLVKDTSDYFGPFADVKAIDTYLGIVNKLFPLRKCKGTLKKREHPCLYYHIKQCPGPCAGLVSKKKYNNRVDQIRRLFLSSPDEMKKSIRKKMDAASAALSFEKAAEFRDSLRAIEAVESRQMVDDFDGESRDYIAFHEHEGLVSFVVFQMRQGKLVGTNIFRSRNFSGNDAEQTLEQFVMRYYEDLQKPPVKIYIDHSSFNPALLQQFFTLHRGRPVSILRPESGRDRRLFAMAQENARQDSFKRAKEFGDEEGITELRTVFKLPCLPRRIEGFDIAQLQGKHTVAALVSFKNGVPDKKEYRYFNIKSLKGKIDDYESIREVIARRYSRLLNEEKALPDLILIDGGKGQLNAACQILESLGLKGLPILSLAKREEEIFLPGQSHGVLLPEGTAGLRVLQAVRDEAHRFGTSLNQRQRSGDLELLAKSVPGFGQKRSRQILAEFDSYHGAVVAGAEEINSRTGIPLVVAESFVEYFNQNDDEKR